MRHARIECAVLAVHRETEVAGLDAERCTACRRGGTDQRAGERKPGVPPPVDADHQTRCDPPPPSTPPSEPSM